MSHEPGCISPFQIWLATVDCEFCKIIRASTAKGDKLTLTESLLAIYDGDEGAATGALAVIDQIQATLRDKQKGSEA